MVTAKRSDFFETQFWPEVVNLWPDKTMFKKHQFAFQISHIPK